MFIFLFIVLCNASRNNLKLNSSIQKLKDLEASIDYKIKQKTYEIIVNQNIMVETLAVFAEYYEDGTDKHLDRIQSYVKILGKHLGNDPLYSNYINSKPNYIKEIALASLLHDIGKITIPKEILTKTGRLSLKEFELVKTHTTQAGDILKKANFVFLEQFNKDSYLALASDIAQYHHEKWDGTGYPLGLAGHDIPLSARIVALAEVYDALRSKRPYKKAWTHEEALLEIMKNKGRQFDPVIVDAFIENADKFKDLF